MKPTALILRSAGTNCDAETAYAFELAGARAEKVHVNRLIAEPRLLQQYQLLAIPGGFSYGDDIAAGRILASQIAHHLKHELRQLVDSGRPVVGICNGFQVLVKTDLLPGFLAGRAGQNCTLTNNDCGRFVDRWVRLAGRSQKCIWTAGIDELELPVAHGEGKFIAADESVRQALCNEEKVALVYVASDGEPAKGRFPENPNGSVDDIAGICDASGLILGLMPHPERCVDAVQHPAWSRTRALPTEGAGLQVFRNAVDYVTQALGAGV